MSLCVWMLMEDVKVSLLQRASISRRTPGQCLCGLIRYESLQGRGPQRERTALSSASKIIVFIKKNAGSDKDHHLRITGWSNCALTCQYKLAIFGAACTNTHLQSVYGVSADCFWNRSRQRYSSLASFSLTGLGFPIRGFRALGVFGDAAQTLINPTGRQVVAKRFYYHSSATLGRGVQQKIHQQAAASPASGLELAYHFSRMLKEGRWLVV